MKERHYIMRPIHKPQTKPCYHFAKSTPASQEQQEHETEVTVTVEQSGFSKIAVKINIVRPVCSLMFGKNHSLLVRILSGVFIAGLGVIVAKYLGHFENTIVAHVGDGIGYTMHAIGITPIIEEIANRYEA